MLPVGGVHGLPRGVDLQAAVQEPALSQGHPHNHIFTLILLSPQFSYFLNSFGPVFIFDILQLWDGSQLILGTMYSYDIFAAVPCCADRLKVSMGLAPNVSSQRVPLRCTFFVAVILFTD